MATIGFNLPFDSPLAMKEFARRHGVERPNWEFLSPDPAGVDALTRAFGFSSVATASGFDHIMQVTIVDASGRVHAQVYGESFGLPILVAPLRELVLGTPAPRADLRTLLEKVRIVCTVYDPASGKYRLNYGLDRKSTRLNSSHT